ncbi:MAG TPA: nucleotidyltransferase family protein [Chloroflexota bacterium]
MKANIRSSYPHLSTAEGWLLSAATQPRPVARAAWELWRTPYRLETAAPPSQALFAMLYANLIADLGGPDETLLKGVYRRTWYGNQLVLAHLKPLLDRLAAQDVATILLNDASLVVGHYPDIGYRTIRCIDILVRVKDWNSSIRSAGEEGWQAEPGKSFVSPTSLSIMTFAGSECLSLRIWANVFAAEPREDTEDRIWQEARCVQVNGRPIVTLGPVEQLLCLSAEALRVREPPLFLYADARLLVQSLTATSDWTRLVWQAQRYEHILPLRNMLGFLQAKLSIALPPWVLPALHKMAISHAELLQYYRACESLPLRLKSKCLRWLLPLLPRQARGT